MAVVSVQMRRFENLLSKVDRLGAYIQKDTDNWTERLLTDFYVVSVEKETAELSFQEKVEQAFRRFAEHYTHYLDSSDEANLGILAQEHLVKEKAKYLNALKDELLRMYNEEEQEVRAEVRAEGGDSVIPFRRKDGK